MAKEIQRLTAEREYLGRMAREYAEEEKERVAKVRSELLAQQSALQKALDNAKAEIDHLQSTLRREQELHTETKTALERARSDVIQSEAEIRLLQKELDEERRAAEREGENQTQKASEEISALQAELTHIRREHSKTVITMRQIERQLAKEREQRNEEDKSKVEYLEEKLAARDAQLANARKERNALLAALRQKERLLGESPEPPPAKNVPTPSKKQPSNQKRPPMDSSPSPLPSHLPDSWMRLLNLEENSSPKEPSARRQQRYEDEHEREPMSKHVDGYPLKADAKRNDMHPHRHFKKDDTPQHETARKGYVKYHDEELASTNQRSPYDDVSRGRGATYDDVSRGREGSPTFEASRSTRVRRTSNGEESGPPGPVTRQYTVNLSVDDNSRARRGSPSFEPHPMRGPREDMGRNVQGRNLDGLAKLTSSLLDE